MFQKTLVENIITHILGSITFYELTWKNMIQATHATDFNIARRMRFACWVTEATNTHSEYVILIAFPH